MIWVKVRSKRKTVWLCNQPKSTFPLDEDGRFEIIVFLLGEIKEIENTGLKISKVSID